MEGQPDSEQTASCPKFVSDVETVDTISTIRVYSRQGLWVSQEDFWEVGSENNLRKKTKRLPVGLLKGLRFVDLNFRLAAKKTAPRLSQHPAQVWGRKERGSGWTQKLLAAIKKRSLLPYYINTAGDILILPKKLFRPNVPLLCVRHYSWHVS